MNKPLPKAYTIPAPKTKKIYQPFDDGNLRDFAEKYSRAYNNGKIDEEFIQKFCIDYGKHFSLNYPEDSATPEAKKEILTRMSAVYEILSSPETDDKKTLIAYKLKERVETCTAGFLIGLQEITSNITDGNYEVDAMLYSIRDTLCQKVISQLTIEVHAHNSVMIKAQKLGFGIKPLMLKENDVHFTKDWVKVIYDASEDKLTELFGTCYQFPYIFFKIMEEIDTLYQTQKENDSLTLEAMEKIKKALQQTFPSEFQQIEDNVKKYDSALLMRQLNCKAILIELGLNPKEYQTYFNPEWKFTKEELMTLTRQLKITNDETTNAALRKRKIFTLNKKIEIYQKVLENSTASERKPLLEKYRTLKSSIQTLQYSPPEKLEDILFMIDEHSGKTSLNIKNIRSLLWKKLSSERYFEFSSDEKTHFSAIFEGQDVEAHFEKLIHGKNIKTIAIYLNSFQQMLSEEWMIQFLNKIRFRYLADYFKLIQYINFHPTFYPIIVEKCTQFRILLTELMQLINNHVATEKIIPLIEHMPRNSYRFEDISFIIDSLKSNQKNLIIPLLNHFKDIFNRYISDEDKLLNYLFARESNDVHEKIIEWYQRDHGQLTESFLKKLFRHRDQQYGGILIEKRNKILSAFLKNNPNFKIKLPRQDFAFDYLDTFIHNFPQHVSAFELEPDQLINFFINPGYIDSTYRKTISKTITKSYLEDLKLDRDIYTMILPFLLNEQMTNLEEILEIPNCKQALMSDNKLLDSFLRSKVIDNRYKSKIIDELSEQQRCELFKDSEIFSFLLQDFSVLSHLIINSEQFKQLFVSIMLYEKELHELFSFLNLLDCDTEFFKAQDKISIYFDVHAALPDIERQNQFMESYLIPQLLKQPELFLPKITEQELRRVYNQCELPNKIKLLSSIKTHAPGFYQEEYPMLRMNLFQISLDDQDQFIKYFNQCHELFSDDVTFIDEIFAKSPKQEYIQELFFKLQLTPSFCQSFIRKMLSTDIPFYEPKIFDFLRDSDLDSSKKALFLQVYLEELYGKAELNIQHDSLTPVQLSEFNQVIGQTLKTIHLDNVRALLNLFFIIENGQFQIPSELMLTFLQDKQLDEKKKMELLGHVAIEAEYLTSIDSLSMHQTLIKNPLISEKYTAEIFIQVLDKLKREDRFMFLLSPQFKLRFKSLNQDERTTLLSSLLENSINAPDLKIPFYRLFQHLEASEKSAFVDRHLKNINIFLSSKNSDEDFPDLFKEFFQGTSDKLTTSSIFRKLSNEESSNKKMAIFDYFREILALSNQLTKTPQQKAAEMAALNARFINTYQNPPLKIYQHLANFFMIMFFRLDLILSYSCGYDILYSRSNDITRQIQEIYTEMTSEAITPMNEWSA